MGAGHSERRTADGRHSHYAGVYRNVSGWADGLQTLWRRTGLRRAISRSNCVRQTIEMETTPYVIIESHNFLLEGAVHIGLIQLSSIGGLTENGCCSASRHRTTWNCSMVRNDAPAAERMDFRLMFYRGDEFTFIYKRV
jgi:hypothetical protein